MRNQPPNEGFRNRSVPKEEGDSVGERFGGLERGEIACNEVDMARAGDSGEQAVSMADQGGRDVKLAGSDQGRTARWGRRSISAMSRIAAPQAA